MSACASSVLLVENANSGTAAASVFSANTGAATVSLFSHGSGRTLSRFGQVLGGWTELVQTNGNGVTIGTQFNKPLILGTNSLERIRVSDTGKVGINVPAPWARLTVLEVEDGGTEAVAWAIHWK